jgi:hypothetical protein
MAVADQEFSLLLTLEFREYYGRLLNPLNSATQYTSHENMLFNTTWATNSFTRFSSALNLDHGISACECYLHLNVMLSCVMFYLFNPSSASVLIDSLTADGASFSF